MESQAMNWVENINIRLEEKTDFRKVEELTREAFWDVNVPGCDEHFLAHILRKSSVFVKELDFVACSPPSANSEEQILANIMYSKAFICDQRQDKHEVLTFGPLSVLPKYQNLGIGRKLIEHSVGKAREIGFKAIFIYGEPRYYSRFGFIPAESISIRTKDGYYNPALQAIELEYGFLRNIRGYFCEGDIFELDPQKAEEFDKLFPAKTKGFKASQLRFKELISMSHI
jgi:predicted N-acetyltransferase YhbS